MHINNPDALKNWLSVILEPLCDADPPALSRYVLALLKKDKPVKELSQCMAEQLEVFLLDNTKSFLDKLFNVIKSEEYLKNQEISLENVSELNTIIEKDKHENTPPLCESNTKEIKSKVEDNPSKSTVSTSLNSSSNTVQNILTNTALSSPAIIKTHQASPPKEKGEKDNSVVREARRRRISLRSRSRSRSRSYDRSRRSRSRERRINDREKNSRQFRNKSPPQQVRERYPRRNNERSPILYDRIRNRSNSESRSRSGSPDRRKISRSMSPSNEGPPVKRLRCRDFDEKGYCMRGETCPWDHGIDPVVLEDINNTAIISSMQSGGGMRTGQIHGEYNPDTPDLWNRSGNFLGPRVGLPHRPNTNPGTYPRGPINNFRALPPFQFPLNSAVTPLQRELVPVPVVDGSENNTNELNQPKRRFEPEESVAIAEGPVRRKIPINNRLGPRPQQNCSLELRKVPRGLNSIAHLNNHFSKFGKIFNIQISYDGDPEAAIITFSSHAEANVAYRSTEAVLNNRFIKVFWHSSSGSNSTSINGDQSVMPVKDDPPPRRIFTSQHTLSNVPATPVATTTETVNSDKTKGASASTASNQSSTNVILNSSSSTQTPAQIRLKNSRITRATNELIRKKQEEQIKTAVQLAHGLHKRKHDLLQEYLKQMRSAVELIEKVDQSDPKRGNLLKTVKDLQASIDKLKNEISVEQAQITAQISQKTPTNMKKSKEQQQKELLDIELELITQQQEGNDTSAIQKRYIELQRSFGTTPRPHFARSLRVRPAPPGSTSVDRRPTTITIIGFSLEESDSLLGHFKHFGEITKNVLDNTIPSLTISYATRSNAEQAILRGRTFKDKRIQITWANPIPVIQQRSENLPVDSIEIADTTSTELTLEDEEEEEDAESEERSWRR